MQVQASPSPGSINVFISFVPPGEKTLRRELVEALSPLSRLGLISLWHDGELQPGRQREAEISRHLHAAQLILLLVSPACTNSHDWWLQMQAIMQREQSGHASVIPVLLRPTIAWQETPFGQLFPLPADGRAITESNPHGRLWHEVATDIHKQVVHLRQEHQGENTRPSIIPEPELQLRQDLRSEFPRHLRTQPPGPHPTRVQRPPLVAETYQRLTDPAVTTLILTGICGLGKSTLAAQVYHFAEEQRRAGLGPFQAKALWLDIDATMGLPDVFGTLCNACGLAPPAFQTMTAYELVAELYNILQNSQPRLIILNQFEHWLNPQTRSPRTEHPGIGEWLDLLDSHSCASRILLTSRIYPRGKSQLLNAYVQRFAIPGLTVQEGLELLRQGNIEATDEELVSAVTHYQGHPLALALLRDLLQENPSLSVTALLHDLAYKQLWVNDIAENVLHYIYTRQLSQEQRELLLAFSIYRQAVPLSAAQSIANTRVNMPASQAVSALRVLRNQDLLQATGKLEYRLQPVIKDFVLAQERESDPQVDEEQRHQAHRIAAAYYWDRFFSIPQATLQPHMDDFRLLCEAIWHDCQAGQFVEAYRLIQHEKLFVHLYRWGKNNLLLELYSQLLPLEKWGADAPVAGQIYHELGEIYNALGLKHEAQTYYERALPLLRQSEQPALIAEALNNLGTVYRILKQEQRAQDCYQEAWSLCEQMGDQFAPRGATLNNMGKLLYEQCQRKQQSKQKEQALALYQEAISHYERALAEHRRNNLPEDEGRTLMNLGDVYATLGQRNRAFEHYWQALKQFRAVGERRSEGTVLNNLGVLFAYDSDEKQQAANYYIQALQILRSVGDHWQERIVLRNLGRWLILYAPNQGQARYQYYRYSLTCFFAARDVFEERRNAQYETIPGWILESLCLDLGDQQLEALCKEVEARSAHILQELLDTPHDFISYGRNS